MMAGLFLSRVLGIVRDMIMSGKFGRGAETDAYVLAFQIPDLLFFLIAGGALSSAFIPVFSEYLHTDREEDAWKLFSVVVTVMSVVVTAFIAVAWILAVPLTGLVAPDANPDQIPLISTMSRIVLPAQFAFFIGGILFGTLYAKQKFVTPGMGPNIYNLGIIFGALVLSSFFTPGVIGMSWGALIGALVGNLVVPIIAMRSIGAQFTPSFDVSHPGVKKVFRLMLPVVLGLSLPGVYAMIMRAFGTYFDTGVVTSFDYSNKLMQAPLGVFGQSLAIAVFPALTQFFARGEMDRFRAQLGSSLKTVVYLTVPVSLLMAALAPQIVAAVFEHGKFTAADTETTAACLRMFSIGIFAWCLHPVLMRGFFALQRTVTPIVIGTVSTAIFLTLAFVLKATPLTYMALPLASSLAAMVLVVMLLLSVRKAAEGLDLRSLFTTFLLCLAASVLAAAVAYGLATGMAALSLGPRKLMAILQVLIPGSVAGLVYLGVTRKLGMKEAGFVDRALARINRAKG